MSNESEIQTVLRIVREIPCPECKAETGELCKNPDGSLNQEGNHGVRFGHRLLGLKHRADIYRDSIQTGLEKRVETYAAQFLNTLLQAHGSPSTIEPIDISNMAYTSVEAAITMIFRVGVKVKEWRDREDA